MSTAGDFATFRLYRSASADFVPGAGTLVALALEGARPNPAIGRAMMVTLALPSAAPAMLGLIDVAGRRVRGRAVGSLGAGRHAVDLAEDWRLKPGLYFLRLTQGTNERAVRTTVIR